MIRIERSIPAPYLLAVLLLCLGHLSCSGQKVQEGISPGDRLALADELRSRGKCLQAVEEYEKLLSEFPTPQVAEAARFNLAMCHLTLEQYDLARSEFEDFIDSYPRSDRVDNAIYMVAMTYLDAAPRPERDQTDTVQAMNELVVLLREYPDSDIRTEAESALAECRSRLAEKEYLAGKLYMKLKSYGAARIYFDSVLETYGDTPWAALAMLMKGRALAEEKMYDEAEAVFRNVLEDYPDSQAGLEAARELKELEHVQPAGGHSGSQD
jgi:outer membrane protein assembly factor BamD